MFGTKGPTRISSNSAPNFPISYWNYMNIVIVESPAKAKTINKYLGSSYEVLASFGHVRDLPAKNGSVDPDANFKMIWEGRPQGGRPAQRHCQVPQERRSPDSGDRP
ncbi:hypothetical protein ACVWZW_001137 [Bradyrhizobium sp. F1.13.4]